MPRRKSSSIHPHVYVVDYGRPHLVLRWKDPLTRKWRTQTAETSNRDDANRAAAEKEAELSLDSGPNGEMSWSAFRLRYETEYLTTLSRNTFKKAHTSLEYLQTELRPERLADITTDALSAMFSRMRTKKRRSEATIAGYGRQISAALGWAVDMGMLTKAPKMPRQQRYRTESAKGRALTDDEFPALLAVIADVVGEKRAPSWEHYLRGMWWSGLRLEESINELHWTRTDKMRVDLSSGRHPVLIIRAEGEKGYQDREYPVAPEFGIFLQATPPEQRTGYVFSPLPYSHRGERPSPLTIGRTVIKFAEKAGILTKDESPVDGGLSPKSSRKTRPGERKFASLHDFRRAFGFRWAMRVMPAVLKEMMRHASIDTTMKYYVTRNAQATGDVIWNAVSNLELSNILGNKASGDVSESSVSPDSKTA